MASNKAALLSVFFLIQSIHSTEYILGDLNKCERVPDEAPCNIPYDYFVPEYASRRYQVLMELIYRKSKDIARLDSRAQCVDAYKTFLCAQLFPNCRKMQNPRYSSLEMKRWVVHDPAIRVKCHNIFGKCNEYVARRFMSSQYFICDHLSYVPQGWQSDRCTVYDEDTRCKTSREYGKLPLWYMYYHDQNVVEYLNATMFRINHMLPESCILKIFNTLCRHPVCSKDGNYLVTNYTRQQCDRYLGCARFVPGEINVDAICILFPSSAMTITSSVTLFLITWLLQYVSLPF